MYRAGERLRCTVISKEPDCYSVAVAEEARLAREGIIKFEQVAVAYYDFVIAGVSLKESLAVRGWL